jgi:hypothetical protein
VDVLMVVVVFVWWINGVIWFMVQTMEQTANFVNQPVIGSHVQIYQRLHDLVTEFVLRYLN